MTYNHNKIIWIRVLGLVFLLGTIYYGVKITDLVIDRFMIQHGLMKEGAAKITYKHFNKPEKSIFNVKNFSMFLDNVTNYREGILAWKPLYVVILFTYLILACLVIISVVMDKDTSENRT